MTTITCNCNNIEVRYCPADNRLSVFLKDLGKYIALEINSETHIKCLPLSGARNCITAHAPKDVALIVSDLDKSSAPAACYTKAHVQGSLSLVGSGNFMLTATSILFKTGSCPFKKNCKPEKALESSATPTEI